MCHYLITSRRLDELWQLMTGNDATDAGIKETQAELVEVLFDMFESVTATNPAVFSQLCEARSRIRKIQKLERAAETAPGAKPKSPTEWMPTETQTTNSQEPDSQDADAPPLTREQLFNKAYADGIRDYQKQHAGNTAKAVLQSFLNSEQSKNHAMARDRKRKNSRDDSERKSQPQMRTVFDVLNL